MLDIGWQELLIIGVIALLVVGPKELPGLLRTIGQWAGRARSVARDFQRSMEDAAREADLEEFKNISNIKRDVEQMGRLDHSEQAKRGQPPKSSAASRTPPASRPAGETSEAGTVASEPASGATPEPESPETQAARAAGASSET